MAYWLIVVSDPLDLGLATTGSGYYVFFFIIYLPITLTSSLAPSKNNYYLWLGYNDFLLVASYQELDNS